MRDIAEYFESTYGVFNRVLNCDQLEAFLGVLSRDRTIGEFLLEKDVDKIPLIAGNPCCEDGITSEPRDYQGKVPFLGIGDRGYGTQLYLTDSGTIGVTKVTKYVARNFDSFLVESAEGLEFRLTEGADPSFVFANESEELDKFPLNRLYPVLLANGPNVYETILRSLKQISQ
jgi:hypothetical protein